MIYINPYLGGFSNLYSNNMDGSAEYATAADDAAFSFNTAGQDTAWSWVIWMKRTGTVGFHILLSKFTSTGNQREWEVSLNASILRFIAYNTTGTILRGRAASMATINTWEGLAGTYSGNEATTGFKLYTITGGTVTQIDSLNITAGVYTGMTPGTSPLGIGAYFNAAATGFFNGRLYHPQLWTGVLTDAVGGHLATIGANQHQDVTTFGFSGVTPISAWHFQDGTADHPTWTDYVAARNATMVASEAADINTDIP